MVKIVINKARVAIVVCSRSFLNNLVIRVNVTTPNGISPSKTKTEERSKISASLSLEKRKMEDRGETTNPAAKAKPVKIKEMLRKQMQN